LDIPSYATISSFGNSVTFETQRSDRTSRWPLRAPPRFGEGGGPDARSWTNQALAASESSCHEGGDLVEQTIRTVDQNVAFTAVRASRGKVTRAEPISALYEQGRVHHLGVFPELEDQMCAFTPDVDRAAGSQPEAGTWCAVPTGITTSTRSPCHRVERWWRPIDPGFALSAGCRCGLFRRLRCEQGAGA
jgi:hypothetical protein